MKELLPLLEEMAANLGTTVEHLWSILLRQAPISAITDLIQYGLIAAAPFFWLKITNKMAHKIKKRDAEEENWIWLFVGWGIIGIAVLCAFNSFPTTVTKIANPEYWATMEILDKISLSE